MIRSLVIATLLFSAAAASAADMPCENGFWTPKGDVMKIVKAWDEMINGLGERKDYATTLNKFGKTNGLPVYVGMKSDDTKEFPDRMEAEGPDGNSALLFMKKMKLTAKSAYALDQVVEVKSAKNKASLMKWPAPGNATAPVISLDGDELIVKQDLTPICAGHTKKTVWMGIKPTGEIRILAPKTVKDPEIISECPAAKGVFPDSSYATCAEITDIQLHTKQILVFEQPMT